MDTPLGSPLRRKEDQRFITGRGRYVEDLRFPDMLHAAFVRSPHAHARVRSIDDAAARAMGSVVAVYTARDLPECARPIPPSIAAPAGFKPTAQPVFADPLVRCVGEVVAAVVAEDPYAAADAAAAVVVDYEPLPAAGTMERALEPGAPRVFDGWPDNVAGLSTARVGDAAAGLAGSDVVVEARLSIARVHGVPIETRGIVATPEGPDGRLTLWTSSQSPYGLRAVVAGAFGIAEEHVRVVVVDTGGGFGIKGHTYSEDLIVAAAARRLGRPVKWAESRREHFLTASPDRGQRHVARLGLTREGRITALETRFTREHGAYVASGEVVTRNTINHLPGPYRIPTLEAAAFNVVTNAVVGGAYRVSGRHDAPALRQRHRGQPRGRQRGPLGGAHRARGGGQGAGGGRGDARVRARRRGAGRGPGPRGRPARARGGPGRSFTCGGAEQDAPARVAAGAAGLRVLRAGDRHLRVRRAGLRGRGGRGDRAGADPPLPGGPRLRARHQFGGGGRPAPRRPGRRDRHRADGGPDLRRRRPAPDRQPDGLRDPGGRRPAQLRDPDARVSLHAQRPRHQGRGRERDHRAARGHRQRGGGRAAVAGGGRAGGADHALPRVAGATASRARRSRRRAERISNAVAGRGAAAGEPSG